VGAGPMNQVLEGVAEPLVLCGKGILAANEIVPTATKNFDIPSSQYAEQATHTYRKYYFILGSAERFGRR
jgi:fructose-bisphosphate aldolase class I